MVSTVLLIYSLISGAVLSLLWAVFRLARINRLTCHGLNRGLLLGILVASIGLPFAAFFEPEPVVTYAPVVIMAPEIAYLADMAEPTPTFWERVLAVLPTIYVIGLVVSAGWLLVALGGVALAIIKGEKRKVDSSTTIVIHSRNITPFTWGRWIIISRSDLEGNPEMLLAHENAHKVAVHWLDLLIGRIVACVDWYWPTVWLLMRDLSAVHEYQADSSVVSGGNDAVAYQMLLLRKGSPGMFSNIANPFSYYSLKNRITMMQKNQSSARSRMRCLVMLPAAAVAILFSTAPVLASTVKSYLPSAGYSIADESMEMYNESTDAQPTESDAEIAEVLKNTPSFPGGDMAMYEFLAANIRYPSEAAERNIQGRVIVEFFVQNDGSITNVQVMEQVNPLLDAEAIRLVQSMPKFVPASENGEMVGAWLALPINFSLNADDAQNKNGENESSRVVPQFPGGEVAMYEFLAKHIRYPREAAERNIQGRVDVQFFVQKDGSITNVQVVNKVNPLLDAEAVRVVESMPKFVPASENGEVVGVWQSLPILFKTK